MAKRNGPIFRLEIQALTGLRRDGEPWSDALARYRRLLKALGRAWGFEVLRHYEVKECPKPSSPT